MEDKIQQIRRERKELGEKILKLKQSICELENSIPYKSYNMKSEYTREDYVVASIFFGLSAVLGFVVGGLIGQMGNRFLLGLLLALPFVSIPASGSIYCLVKAVNKNKCKIKKVNNDSQLKHELNSKEEELEKLEAYDHDLYVQLCEELSKSDCGTLKNFEKCKLTTNTSPWVIDEYEDVKDV